MMYVGICGVFVSCFKCVCVRYLGSKPCTCSRFSFASTPLDLYCTSAVLQFIFGSYIVVTRFGKYLFKPVMRQQELYSKWTLPDRRDGMTENAEENCGKGW